MNAHEAQARAVKAARIADMLSDLSACEPQLTADVLEAATTAERVSYAAAAGASVPSDTTWAVVIAILRDRERRAVTSERISA